MGKPPKNKSLADKVRKTKTSTQIKNNPFEVKVNRKKFDVLGRKTKHDVGLPGVSRSKAINKRKETLLKEYKQKGKANKFIDRRFGEYDTKMEPEEKILQRFAMERQRAHDGKKDLYNLNEEEELTHYGQSLAEMEKHNDLVDSDSDSEEKGLLSAELTASHFGGGGLLRKKVPGEKGAEGDSLKARSRQELIEELIQKSKQEKRERQTQKEESQVLTEKLDQDWKSIQALLAHKTPKAERPEKEEEKPKLDEYDMMVRELGFEMKAQPSERLKTPDELAREEKERLQNLEEDRIRRMMGDVVEDKAKMVTHFSADDLNDGFILDKEDKAALSYQGGKLITEEESEDEEEGQHGENDQEDGSAEEEGDEGSDSEGESGEEEEDSQSDLDSEGESAGEEEEEEEAVEREEVEESVGQPKSSLTEEERKAQQEAAKAELPYTFTAPESYEDLKALLLDHSPDIQRLIVARTQKSNHPSLAMGNKIKLQKLFGFLLEYVGELASRSPPELATIDKLIPELYGLCQLYPEKSSHAMQAALVDSARIMEEVLEVKGRLPFPPLDMLIYLKIAALLFPTSDFRHPVTTPSLLYISQALTKCPVTSLEDVTSGLMLCCLALDYVSLSKRFLPELVNFLLGTLHLAVPDKISLGYSVVPPFRHAGKCSELLVLSDPEASSCTWSKKSLPLSGCQRLELPTELDQDHYRLSCLSTCLDLLKQCCLFYNDLTSFTHIVHPIRTLLTKHIPVQTYPVVLQELHGKILEAVSSAQTTQCPLVFEKRKPIPLKLYTPKIVEVLDYGKKRGNTKEEKEKERFKHKYKKEFKGALREIRKDTRFLAREKLNEVMSRDSEWKRKVKELFGSLATQEGEWKALKRRKRK
ncbi:nucleolar protein 14 isoform 2-T2 [Aplochiton taeniatus]